MNGLHAFPSSAGRNSLPGGLRSCLTARIMITYVEWVNLALCEHIASLSRRTRSLAGDNAPWAYI